MLVPTFTDFLNIAGSIGSAAIGFVIPSLIYMKQFPKQSFGSKLGCWFILWFGVCGGLYSIYYSAQKLLRGDYS
jgi:amino acid permease